MLNLTEILHVLADGISLSGPVRQELHDAIDAHDAPAAEPADAQAEAQEPAVPGQ